MKEKNPRRQIRKILSVLLIAVLAISTLTVLGSMTSVGVCNLLGYEVVVSKENDSANQPHSILLDSPNNMHHILVHVDSPQEFWEALEAMKQNRAVEVDYYTAMPYQRSDGTWGMIYTLSYRLG